MVDRLPRTRGSGPSGLVDGSPLPTVTAARTAKLGPAPDQFDLHGPAVIGRPASAASKARGRLAGKPLNATTAALAGADVGTRPRRGGVLVTASDVERILDSGDLSSVTPKIPPALWPFAHQLAQALKKEGPLGSHGPLGNRGPIGDHAWNPAFWMKILGDWSGQAADFAANGGPGSAAGPLGGSGPVSKQAYESLLPAMGALANQMQAGGLFAALGPLGPLGAMSALGYLGRAGGHGFAQNEKGAFVDVDGEVQRTTDVRYEGGKRTYELVEMYSEHVAAGMPDNDTSWMIRGALPPSDEQDTFAFTAREDQVVTLTVVPENRRDIFTVELLDESGAVVGKSDSDGFVNWIQLEAAKAQSYQVRVKRKEGTDDSPNPMTTLIDMMLFPLMAAGEMSKPWLRAAGHKVDDVQPHAYRLISTGSPKELGDAKITGVRPPSPDA